MSSYLSQFNYQLFGPSEGRKWVFLHGLMGYGLNWRKIAAGLQQTERVLIYDQRGHGKSWKPLTGYAPEDYAEDLFLITQELGWEKFILVGHSMGGRNALIFASKFPELVEKLIIEDIGPDSNPEAPNYYRKLFDLVPAPFPNKLAAKEFFLNEFPKVFKDADQPDTLGAYLYSNIIELENGQADWRYDKNAMISTVVQGRAQDHWREFRTLPMPTLIIRGEHSKELPKDTFQRMSVSNPRIEAVEVPNAGHWVHSDQPAEFLRIIRSYTGLPA
jgi:pimeloyl-ACP methyl ester carboxylesterase